ncbi:hypothetical protein [Methylibium sp.]|uniref:hypothetical protein n=1 Tax=Methylibium sp. TaxID=2067992 RepID=UPI00179D13A4|nr:hypothetical protein [Methylibium sp.]MBA3588190.1 hypothetical protein [Methylibium sp.]
MRQLDLGTLAAVAVGTSFSTQGAGFLPGELAVARIFSPGGAFAGSAKIQTSPDGTTWTDAGVAVTGGTDSFTVTLSGFARLNCTARTAGSVKAVLENSIG